MVISLWIPAQGSLGRAKTAELPVKDLSMFGASVHAKKSDKLGRGKVVQVTINDETTTAIVRSEHEGDGDKLMRYGLEFIQPSEEFLDQIREVTETLAVAKAKTFAKSNSGFALASSAR